MRAFDFRGSAQLPRLLRSQFTNAINQALLQPYEWSQMLGVSSSPGQKRTTGCGLQMSSFISARAAQTQVGVHVRQSCFDNRRDRAGWRLSRRTSAQ
jgi:hypothetical protein